MTSVLAPRPARSVLAVTRSRVPHPVLVIAPAGTLDTETSPAFADFVDESLRARPLTEAVILDLTEVALLTHGGLRAVRGARRHVERHGMRVVIVAEPGGPVARALSGPTARVYDTRREAISAVRPSA